MYRSAIRLAVLPLLALVLLASVAPAPGAGPEQLREARLAISGMT